MTTHHEKNEQIDALKWEIFEDLFHNTDALVDTINVLLENEMDKEWLVLSMANFFHRYELVSTQHAHPCEEEKEKLLADEAFNLHARIYGAVYRETSAKASALAVKQVEASYDNA